MNYSFDIEIAKKYGVNEAIIYNNILFWIRHNKVNNKNFHDGRYWTFNSQRAFAELFPFWTERQIRTALDNLVNQGVLIKGNYNKVKWDKTTWYAFAEEPEDLKGLTPQGNDYDRQAEEQAKIKSDADANGVPSAKYNNMPIDNSVYDEATGYYINNEQSINQKKSTAFDKKVDGNQQKENYETTENNYRFDEKVGAIPNINTDINTNINTHVTRARANFNNSNNQVSKSQSDTEYNAFESEVVYSYVVLTGKPISEVYQIPEFKTPEKRAILRKAFDNRKYQNWQEVIKSALESDAVKNSQPAFKWLEFSRGLYYSLANEPEKPKETKTEQLIRLMQERFGDNWRERKKNYATASGVILDYEYYNYYNEIKELVYPGLPKSAYIGI